MEDPDPEDQQESLSGADSETLLGLLDIFGPQKGGGRTWWAHLQFTRINIELTVPKKKIEDRRIVGAFASIEKVLAGEACLVPVFPRLVRDDGEGWGERKDPRVNSHADAGGVAITAMTATPVLVINHARGSNAR
jgi:hypothetical protein